MEFYKTALFRIIVSVLALGLIYVVIQSGNGKSEDGVEDGDDGLRCCIAIESSIASAGSKAVGFCYELLNYYADDNCEDISFARYAEYGFNESVWR